MCRWMEGQKHRCVMCEQAKSLDISARSAVFVEPSPQDILEEVVDIIIGSIEIP